ncbi:MAG: hypothetical protein ABIO39_08415 [Caulobacteraceae bacterium]
MPRVAPGLIPVIVARPQLAADEAMPLKALTQFPQAVSAGQTPETLKAIDKDLAKLGAK